MLTNDKNVVDDLKHEYRYLVVQLFAMMEERDSLMAKRTSIVRISGQIRDISSRMQHIDEKLFMMLCLPTEFEPRPMIRTTQKGKQIWYDPFKVIIPDWYKEFFEPEKTKNTSRPEKT